MKKIHIVEAILVILIFGAVVAFLNIGEFRSLQFKPVMQSSVASIVSTMFVIAVFMERSVEAILVPIRRPDRQKIEHDLHEVEENIKNGSGTAAELKKKNNELDMYRLETAKRAYWISFIFGILISLVGVRVISGLVEPAGLEALAGLQKQMFHFIDVVITGGVIAGGSAAIDKIGRKISDSFSLKSVTNS